MAKMAQTKRREYKRSRPNVKARSKKRVTLSPRESTEITGIGLNRTYELLRDGKMPAIVVANRFYIPQAALMRWLESAGGKI
jgi:excisionase family DNA binding protein